AGVAERLRTRRQGRARELAAHVEVPRRVRRGTGVQKVVLIARKGGDPNEVAGSGIQPRGEGVVRPGGGVVQLIGSVHREIGSLEVAEDVEIPRGIEDREGAVRTVARELRHPDGGTVRGIDLLNEDVVCYA